MATPTQLATDALSKAEVLRAEFDFLRSHFEKLNLNEVRERIAVIEDNINKISSKVEQLIPSKDESEAMGAIKQRVTQLEEQKKLGDTRLFQLSMLFVGGIVTLFVQIALLFIKK